MRNNTTVISLLKDKFFSLIFFLVGSESNEKTTVKKLWREWLIDYASLKGWTDKKAIQRRMSIGKKYVFPFLGNMQPAEIKPEDVVQCLKFCNSKTKQTQGKVITALSQFLRWCVFHNLRSSKDRLPTDKDLLEPFLGIHLKSPVNHYPALDWREVPKFIFLVNKKRNSQSLKALLFAILTASRSQPVRLATWKEINFELSEWNIPGSHMKRKQGNKLPHDVPLSRQALKLLEEEYKDSDRNPNSYIFSYRSRAISAAAMRKAIRSLNEELEIKSYKGLRDPYQQNRIVVPHGFRATFTTWAQETNKNMSVVERCLDHKDISDRHNGAYRRSLLLTQRRVLLQEWADFCWSQITEKY